MSVQLLFFLSTSSLLIGLVGLHKNIPRPLSTGKPSTGHFSLSSRRSCPDHRSNGLERNSKSIATSCVVSIDLGISLVGNDWLAGLKHSLRPYRYTDQPTKKDPKGNNASPIMPFTHHSHSGQFCGHAANKLEEIVQTAIAKRMTTLCLTEHIPRDRIDFYPEELDVHDEESLRKLYEDFYIEARRLQKAYVDRIDILVGFESEWIRESSRTILWDLRAKYAVDMFVGSLHHVHTHAIDLDTPCYHRAREVAGGTDEQLFADYFDDQLDMLKELRPPVVGHFDLIRLKSDDPERSFKTWPEVWGKVERNLEFVAGYGGVLELNSSALRKGMTEPYPQVEICRVCYSICCVSMVRLVLLTSLCRSSCVWVAASHCPMTAIVLGRSV